MDVFSVFQRYIIGVLCFMFQSVIWCLQIVSNIFQGTFRDAIWAFQGQLDGVNTVFRGV